MWPELKKVPPSRILSTKEPEPIESEIDSRLLCISIYVTATVNYATNRDSTPETICGCVGEDRSESSK